MEICIRGALLGLFFCGVVAGQHDPHRNAVRHIARGKWEQAGRELAKADPQDSETHFVQMLASLAAEETESAVAQAQAALAAGLPLERLIAGPRQLLGPLYGTAAYQGWLRQHKPSPLLHGPMVGAVTSESAAFWLRTARAAAIQIRVFAEQPGSPVVVSKPVLTTAAADFTAIARVRGLRAGTNYRYEVWIDGQKVVADKTRFQTFPAAETGAQFGVAFGGGAGFVPKWESMWDTIGATSPIALLMLGDNVYIDDPTHDLTGRYCYYRRQSRPEWRRLVASTSVFAIYDDHDFGTNDCIPGPEIEKPAWKRSVWERFRLNWVNPSYGGGDGQPGCWHDFYIGDVHFILLDGRYYRSRQEVPSMLGAVQKSWLKETLKASRGTFKVLASPVPWTENIKPGSRDPWDGFTAEREEIFTFLEKHAIEGVFLIAADRHRTDLRVTRRSAGYDLYEFESSRLTNRHTHAVVKTPGLIWGYNKTCSFAQMQFDTTRPDPQVTFTAIAIDGQEMYTHRLLRSQLKRPRQ
ncbi:MAG: alkaline phosphatase D family protein [Planctomycetota bacterium]|nr:alkaline phosphatase D family protein [Planctomycetota bacterium]